MSTATLSTRRPPARPHTRLLAPRRLEIRCADCGYGGVVRRVPHRCPMCGGDDWELHASRGAAR